MTKEKVLHNNKTYVEWLDSLHTITEEVAATPYNEGKWSPKEILMHMAEWDRFTSEERLPNMKEGAELENIPFEEFNEKAAARAHEQTFEEIILYAKKQRQHITEKLEEIIEEEWSKPFKIGEHKLTIKEYFADFAWHDNHHKEQIESVRQ